MSLWFVESASSGHKLEWKILREVYSIQSAFQHIRVVETEQFGMALILDGIMQTTMGDEFIYHEMLAFVPLLSHPAPKRVLIIGGGDGGLSREVLKVPGVEQVVMVEIDPVVVDVAKRYFPHHTESLNDPRLQIMFEDGAAFLRSQARSSEKFDVILVDSTDPEGDGPGQFLYTSAFHADVKNALNPGGIYVQHTGAPFYNPEVLGMVTEDVGKKFPLCQTYWATVPTYPGGIFTFTAGSLGPDLSQPIRTLPCETRWYTPDIHRLAFALPPYLQNLIRTEINSTR
ncbi:polyamine aminopropyltransferase [Sulfobacillus thermosulfidooxidans]|uniref:polyamine aminopropyltransferase n=1 Tax=Sulfobacillus thermosulfidooxidans TaxID=28034 RepID=UPI0006B67F17|nr:polyamine aminopropyltransferase [Sulfobacillus thermosulfidooxidans]